MRYLSVCSGIEAASVAWHHLGWTPVAFSEIEPFPAAVLKHRFPDVPNYGDMTKFKEWPLEPGSIDLLVGGTPCQSFSVAGLRKGISDPRGGLMLTYLEIAQRLRPRWLVWENVPGVLSSGGGRDFGSFLGALAELRYGWAYRVIDAQYCRVDGRWPKAVPQRRRRVFVVGCDLERDPGGRERAAEVLALGTGLRWHLEESRKTRKAAPADAEAGVGAGCWWDGGGCAGTLTKQNAGGAQRMPDKDNFGAVLQSVTVRSGSIGGFVQDDVGGTMRAKGGDYHGGSESLVMWPADVAATLDRSNKNSGGPGGSNQEIFSQHGANLVPVPQPVAFSQNQREEVREVEVPGALAAEPGTHQQTYIAQPVPYDLFQITAPVNRQNRKPGDPCHTLARDNAAHAAVAFAQNQVGEIRTSNVSGTINTNSNASGRNTPMAAVAHAFYSTGGTHGVNQHPEVSPAVKVGSGLGIPSPPAVAHALRGEGFDASEDGTGRGTPLVPQAMTVRRLTPTECSRLQGFPDDWTLIPWRGKPAEQCPDGPRYKALGNSMAVNCMAWLGERIAAVEGNP